MKLLKTTQLGFPAGAVVKNPPNNVRDHKFDP